jgi:Outer membrane protein beta-barrel domain
MVARRLVLAAALLALSAHAALAQNLHVGVDVGTQTRASSFGDTFDVPLYLETEHVAADYPRTGGLFVSFGARYRLWKHLTAGVVVSAFSDTGDATVKATLPHPFVDNTPRNIEGVATTKRQELSVSPTVGWILPLSSSVRLAVNAGPAVMTVKQQFATAVKFSETYPYDTAAFTSADLTESSKTAVGLFVGADVAWMFSKHVGVGGAIQLARATMDLKVSDRTVSIDAGGTQAGGGVRFVF